MSGQSLKSHYAVAACILCQDSLLDTDTAIAALLTYQCRSAPLLFFELQICRRRRSVVLFILAISPSSDAELVSFRYSLVNDV